MTDLRTPFRDPPTASGHPDPEARLLAPAAVAALPDVTGLLVLADRFQELGDVRREALARRMAAGAVREPESRPGFGLLTLREVLWHLPPAEANLAAWLALWWALKQIPPDPLAADQRLEAGEAVRAAAPVAIGFARSRRSPPTVIRLWRQVRAARAAEQVTLGGWGLADGSEAGPVAEVSARAVRTLAGGQRRAWAKALWSIGGLIEVAAGRDLAALGAEVREERRQYRRRVNAWVAAGYRRR